ncbi:Glycoside hydrolase family 16 protein, partial [Rhizoctonia solani]
MKAFTILAFAGIAAAQLPSFADSLNLVDTFMHDLQISFHEITGNHPRRSFHKRAPGKLAKRCIRRPSGYPGPGGNTTTTTRSASGSASSTRTSTRASGLPSISSTTLISSSTLASTTSDFVSTIPTTTSRVISTTRAFPTFSTTTSIISTSSVPVTSTTSTTSTTPISSTSATSFFPLPIPTSTSIGTTTRTSSSTSSSTHTSSSVPSSTSSSTSSAPTPSSTWTLQTRMEGNTFFDGWEFWSYPDPTNGNIPSPQSPSFTKPISTTGAVDYQNLDGSSSAGLHEINSDGHAIMRVETTQQVSGNRKSVRLHSHVTYNGGLVILDAVHMPYGCGTWPAFWSNGPNWPNGGEIDIVEGVNDYQTNQASLHTKSGCTIPQEYGSSGTLAASLNCAADETGNQGCGQLNSKPNNYGKSFNDNGGGVYAMKWDRSGISIYFFPRDEIPSDIENEAPRPDRWGTPVGNWPAQSCDPFEFMSDHIMIFDTTLCGDWAGNAWQSSGIAGQARTCADMTGYNTCLDYIRNEGSKLKDAFWEVKSVKLYT